MLEEPVEAQRPETGLRQLLQHRIAVPRQSLEIRVPETTTCDDALLDRHLLEARVQPHFQRALTEQTRAERMNRPDEDPVDAVERRGKSLGNEVVFAGVRPETL